MKLTVGELIAKLREVFGPFNGPATTVDVARLEEAVGPLPADVLEIYRDHDGSPSGSPDGDRLPWPARLLPVQEAIATNRELAQALANEPKVGAIAWLWTDDNSNYVGVHTAGELAGWLVKLNHDEAALTPAYRSVRSFLRIMIDAARGTDGGEGDAYDVVSIPRELPATSDDPSHVDGDRRLAESFHRRYLAEGNRDWRRFYATCAVCLTPVADTERVLPMLAEDDMWLPESAVRLLELRRYAGGIDELERLAREGRHNGQLAALRHLVGLDTDDARGAIARLERSLTGTPLEHLRGTLQSRHRLQPPRWD